MSESTISIIKNQKVNVVTKSSPQVNIEDELEFKSLMLDNASDSIFVLDETGRIIMVNSAAYKDRGFTKEELIGKPIDEVDAPHCKERVRQNMVKLLQDGHIRVDTQHLKKDGSLMDVEVNARIINHNGQKVIIGVLRDITERKSIEKDLRENEEKFRIMFEHSSIGMALSNDKGMFLKVNNSYCKMLGYSAKELLTTGYPAITHPDDVEANLSYTRKCLAGEIESFQMEKRYITKKGKVIWVSLRSSLVRDANNKPLYFVGQVQDITQRKKVETEKKLANNFNLALNYINSSINSTLDTDEIMKRVVTDAAYALGCDASAIILNENEHWTFKYHHGLPKKVNNIKLGNEEAVCSTKAATSKKHLVNNHSSHNGKFCCHMMEQLKIKSSLSVPLNINNNAVGVLDFYYRSKPVEFTDLQIAFANKLAHSISLAFENAKLYEKEHNIAETLQESLLKVPQNVKGVKFGHLYQPATKKSKVGGDFYDIFQLSNSRAGVIIGDVSGKGIEAASLTSLVKNTIKAYAFQGDEPSQVMSKTNEIVLNTNKSSTFVTVFFGILNTKTGEFEYCSAGHPEAFIKQGSKVMRLKTYCRAIGIIDQGNFCTKQIKLKSSDTLILYTDGVTEARCSSGKNNKGFYGERRLISAIKNCEKTSPKNIPAHIFKSIMKCTGCQLQDDIIILALSLSK